ncbi:MarR family winged helix-turn-helix transcriptional regulator, partial [Streptomyces calidiresistens]
PGGEPGGGAEDAARVAARLVELWEVARVRTRDPVPPAQLRALGVLAAEQPMACGRLGARLRLTPSAAGRLCARMEDAGLLRRGRAETDRRRTELVLTPAGWRTLLAVRSDRREVMRELLAADRGTPGEEGVVPPAEPGDRGTDGERPRSVEEVEALEALEVLREMIVERLRRV